jgi:hypothetical protein
VPTDVIGETDVPSGQVASVEWTDLPKGEARAWIVSATTSGGGSSVAEPAVFRTAGKATLQTSKVTAQAAPQKVTGETFSLKVAVTAGSLVPTGDVTVSFHGTQVASGTLSSNGTVTLDVNGSFPTGQQSFTATYLGSAEVAPSSKTFTVQFVKSGT